MSNPFVKTRAWYLLSLEERQKLMDGHIRIGNKYPSVKLNTTYSFGLDDQDFVVAFETDEPKDFLDLVMGAAGDRIKQIYPARHADLYGDTDADGADFGGAFLIVDSASSRRIAEYAVASYLD